MSENTILATIKYSNLNRVFHNLDMDKRREVLMRLQGITNFDAKAVKKVIAQVKRSH